jgi:hypothetical protein
MKERPQGNNMSNKDLTLAEANALLRISEEDINEFFGDGKRPTEGDWEAVRQHVQEIVEKHGEEYARKRVLGSTAFLMDWGFVLGIPGCSPVAVPPRRKKAK